MSAMTEAFMSVFEKGGPVLAVIFVQFLLMWYFASEKFLYFKTEFSKDFKSFKQKALNITADNEYLFEARLEKETSLLKEKINKNFSVIKTLVMLCPLLGLLGTVTGMISVFDVLSAVGSGNARAMASGISKATIPTMAGMVGALVGLLATKFLKDESKKSLDAMTDFLSQIAIQRKNARRLSK